MTARIINHNRSSPFWFSAAGGISFLAVAGCHVARQPQTRCCRVARSFCRSTKSSRRRAARTSPCRLPLQGDDSHVHLQNVRRAATATAFTACAATLATNWRIAHANIGNPKWSLPAPEHKMVFAGARRANYAASSKIPSRPAAARSRNRSNTFPPMISSAGAGTPARGGPCRRSPARTPSRK